MNFKIYAIVALTAVLATPITAQQQQLCRADGCAYEHSHANKVISKCCQAINPDPVAFYDCCRISCNMGSPCKAV
uniref:Phytotoxin-like SCR74 n=1 Tax=Phytophthora infestans TaxID=4787 RepID=Q646V1_PHYIN|nr:phytotoxin-like SCR74 [Phytophthora infestans]AAU21457.1 phytotoxin-like SCR74 [Phytophthora infestans]AAU21458.1 phytotoxin-like SCR74 [Phytophthora infestans]